MLIKPIERDGELFESYENESSLTDIRNEMIIHDLDMDINTPHNMNHRNTGLMNDTYNIGGVTQTITSIVKGFPSKQDTSLIKRCYFYNIFMGPPVGNKKSFEDRFKDATLKLKGATTNGFIKLIDRFYGSIPDSNNNYNPFSLIVYTVDNQVITSISDAKKSMDIKLDVCSPLDLENRPILDYNNTLCNHIPKVYYGSDFLNGNVKIKKCENRINDVENEKLRAKITSMLPDPNNPTGYDDNLWTTIELRMAIRNLIVDLVKVFYNTLFDEYILLYRSGYKSGFKRLVNPVNTMVDGLTLPEMNYVNDKFTEICKTFENRFNEEVDIKYYITSHESICRVKLLKSNLTETKRMTNLDSLLDYITESMQNPYDGINKFKRDMDLDKLMQYSHHKDGYKIVHNGNL